MRGVAQVEGIDGSSESQIQRPIELEEVFRIIWSKDCRSCDSLPPVTMADITHPSWPSPFEIRRKLAVFLGKKQQQQQPANWLPLLDSGYLDIFPATLWYFIPQKYLHEVGGTGYFSFP